MKKIFYKAYSDMFSIIREFTEKSVYTKKVIMGCKNIEQLKSSWNMAIGFEKQAEDAVNGFVRRNWLANTLSFGSLRMFLEKQMERKMETILDYYNFRYTRLK